MAISFNYIFKPYIKQNYIWYNGKISYGSSRTFYRHIPFCWPYGKQRMSAHGKRKKNRNCRWRNFSTLLTLQNSRILGNQTVSVRTNCEYRICFCWLEHTMPSSLHLRFRFLFLKSRMLTQILICHSVNHKQRKFE